MNKLVISLLKRTDRKRSFQKNNLSNYRFLRAVDGSQTIFRHCLARKGWLEPFKGRKLLQNEVACFISHANAWALVAEADQPTIIMEDDAVINAFWDEDLFAEQIKGHDMLYLQRNENEPTKCVQINAHIEKPYFPYNMTAYVLTPRGARKLLEQVDYANMIPVDNFLPELIQAGIIDAVALIQDACNQLPRDGVGGSDIENDQEFRPFKIHAVTCGDDRKRCNMLNTSARLHGIDVKNIGMNVVWEGTDMSGPGGGMKVNLLKDYIKDLHNDDVILFTDAFDVFYADNINTIYERYVDLSAEVIFSAEAICWPDDSLADDFPASATKYRYLNSGTFIGKVSALKKILEKANIKNSDDDQLFYQKEYLKFKHDIKLDYEGYIFQTHDTAVERLGDQINNPETNVCSCIYHGNGGDEAKQKFDSLYAEMYPTNYSTWFIPNYNKFEMLTDDMLLVDFMTQDQCERLIDLSDQHGGWGSLEYDKFPAQEIRLKELGLWQQLDAHWQEHIVPLVERYWQPLQMYGLRDGFVMRYAMDTQVSLNLHHDASLVTGSVKLNDDYIGAELVYPRQHISNTDIPVGKCILFPGQVSHGHECLPLKSGVKYSLTIWTARYVGDTI